MNNLNSLILQLQSLQKENQYLKSLLDKAGISYDILVEKEEFDLNQGARILPKRITQEDANIFFSMFWGRTDVYAKRVVKRTTGEANYFPQCENFWSNVCLRKSGSKIKCSECRYRKYRKLSIDQIFMHLQGDMSDGSDVIGVYPVFANNTCRFIVFDFDNHDKDTNINDYDNNEWKEEVDALRKICIINGIDPLVERSRSGKGAHLWIFFQKPIEVSLARKFGNALLYKGFESVNLKSYRYFDRLLPMQDYLDEDKIGNLIALPLQGQALKSGNSAFIDENWNAYPNQWEILLSKPKLTKEFIESKIKEWSMDSVLDLQNGENINNEDYEKPWKRTKEFVRNDVDGIMNIVLADSIYVETTNLSARIQNRIRELAAFSNPEFYKNQAIGLSNFKNSRFIYLGRDENNYIRIPRGLLEVIKEKCNKSGIKLAIEDNRCGGRKIDVEFKGKLKNYQIPAVESLLKNENGILHAATSFGKTVVCCNLIAKRKVNTLILLQSSSLIEQWKNAIDTFINFNEELPEYVTPSGKIKKRKNIVGLIQGSHDSSTGIVDIAMVGSLCKKGVYHKKLSEYGMVILDECHHAASDTIVNVLNEVCAKYVYGVTATPKRTDNMQRINYMMIGPIRYKYTSKERALAQGIDHFVYPRFTRTVYPRFFEDKNHPNKMYEILKDNEERDNLIVNDIVQCIKEGRTPVVLSKYVNHSKRLYEKLVCYADKVFLLTGKNSKKEHKELLNQLYQVKKEESLILVATGKLIGEGFDYPRLDTLIMATPVAGDSVVEQYAGRLNRDYDGKENVIIYDYVDRYIPMFDNMYHKRLKAYKQIGYDVCMVNSDNKQDSNSIFDVYNYLEVYLNDLKEAKKEIIISSPAISSKKVNEVISLLNSKQEEGVNIGIVTWKPDNYGYGDSSYWMELHENMRQAGYRLKLVDDTCQHYCIIDNEVVWYGSMNFLGKEDVEDNLMRIKSSTIANELLELTFNNKQE